MTTADPMFHVEPAFTQAGLHPTPEFLAGATLHLQQVYRWNKVHDLTAVPPKDAAVRHTLDSVLPFIPLTPAPTVLDVGSGAGFPGIPLALWWPGSVVTLCEPLRKRRSFLETVVASLNLSSQLTGTPLEQLTGEWDVVTSRATLPWPKLLEASLPRLKPGGLLVALLGPDQAPSQEQLPDLPGGSGWEKAALHHYSLPSGAPRTVLRAKKCST